MQLQYHTAGESHGPGLTILVQGLPAGLSIDTDLINNELRRRQGGYGRGGRQKIETDAVTFTAGVRRNTTIGAPVVMTIPNKDSRLDDLERTPPVYRPRPGHADLAGSVKWLTTDCRETLERASARETAARTAAGALAKCLLKQAFNIEVFGFLRGAKDAVWQDTVTPDNWQQLKQARDESDVYCPCPQTSEKIREHIRQAKIDKDTVGGLIEVNVFNPPIGLGSSMDWRDKLDARLAYAVMSIQAFKSVEIGLGRETFQRNGSQVHDPIQHNPDNAHKPNLGFDRPSNNAGGLEGGITNGMPIVITGVMKPIATLLKGLPSVNLNSKQPEHSQYERSDVCAASAASVVMENVVAFEVARAALEKFPADTLLELSASYKQFLNYAQSLPLQPPIETLA